MAHLWGPVRRRRAAVAVVVALVASVLMTPTVAAPVGAVPIEPPDTTQYPFACTVFQELGVQPMVDNQDGEGIPVIDETKVPLWRDACTAITRGAATCRSSDRIRNHQSGSDPVTDDRAGCTGAGTATSLNR